MPNEILRDVLLPLDRWTLDAVQFTDRRFLHLITGHMSDVCLRQVDFASFWIPHENMHADWTSLIQIDGRPEREIRIKHEDTAPLFSDFVQALRSSRVACLSLDGLVFTPELAALVFQTPIFADELALDAGSCVELTPTQFQNVLLHFSPTFLDITATLLRACQLTDGLLRTLSENRVQRIKFPNVVPVDGGSFRVTDDAIIDFCVREDVPIGRGDELRGELVVCNGSFTKQLFKRLVESSSVSMRSRPLQIFVSPVPIEEEDLRGFAQHLSYRWRGKPWQKRIYDLHDEQNGTDTAMHRQIVLDDDDTLEMVRARRPYLLFTESNE